MKQKTKKKILEILEIVFITGETRMYLVWLLFIIGFFIGKII
jgi:hypothetical protein